MSSTVKIPDWVKKYQGSLQTPDEMNELAQAVIFNAKILKQLEVEVSNIKEIDKSTYVKTTLESYTEEQKEAIQISIGVDIEESDVDPYSVYLENKK